MSTRSAVRVGATRTNEFAPFSKYYTITHSYCEEKGGFFLTQAFTEKCIVFASKRKGLAAPACGAAGGGAADLELEPTHDMYELSCQTQSMKSLDLIWLVKVQYNFT